MKVTTKKILFPQKKHAREFLFQAVSVAIAKGNRIILNTMDQEGRMSNRDKHMRGKPFSAKPDLTEKSQIAVSIQDYCQCSWCMSLYSHPNTGRGNC